MSDQSITAARVQVPARALVLVLASLATTPGVIAASAIFGAVHAFNFLDDPGTTAVTVPVVTVLGTGLWLAYQGTGHKLSTSVAMHFW